MVEMMTVCLTILFLSPRNPSVKPMKIGTVPNASKNTKRSMDASKNRTMSKAKKLGIRDKISRFGPLKRINKL